MGILGSCSEVHEKEISNGKNEGRYLGNLANDHQAQDYSKHTVDVGIIAMSLIKWPIRQLGQYVTLQYVS